jgi:pyruvate dehydrogenase phosphatase
MTNLYGLLKQPFNGPYITHAPDVVIRDIRPNDEYLILASDGLWDELSPEYSASVVEGIDDKETIATRLL